MAKTMQAAVVVAFGQPLAFREYGIPSPGPSSLTSVPDHLPHSTRSPAATSSATIGFSWTVSGSLAMY